MNRPLVGLEFDPDITPQLIHPKMAIYVDPYVEISEELIVELMKIVSEVDNILDQVE